MSNSEAGPSTGPSAPPPASDAANTPAPPEASTKGKSKAPAKEKDPEAVAKAKAAKAAKEAKKEKRAAAVAARGGGAGGDHGPDGAAGSVGGAAAAGAKGGKPTHHGGPSESSTSKQQPSGGSAQMGAQPSGSGVGAGVNHKRPPIMASDSSALWTPSQQNLFFAHLPTHRTPNTPLALESAKLHPLIVRLGVMMSSGTLRGANARTMGMMAAFKEVIRDYVCPDQAVLWKDLQAHLSPMITWLETCRPKGVGGGNAIRMLKSEITRLGQETDLSEREQKDHLINIIDVYIRDRIEYADKVIADNAKQKIKPGDVVVTYARSSVVERALLEAWTSMRQADPEASFEVIIVDSRPLLEGRNLLASLNAADIPCTYALLPQLASCFLRANLVLLGASALHSDGALFARAGTALVAMQAKEHRVPVVACVETYKFGERVALDAVAANELGDASSLLKIPNTSKRGVSEKAAINLTPLSLMYDLTPPSLITAVCTEIGFIPANSVPTVLSKGGAVV